MPERLNGKNGYSLASPRLTDLRRWAVTCGLLIDRQSCSLEQNGARRSGLAICTTGEAETFTVLTIINSPKGYDAEHDGMGYLDQELLIKFLLACADDPVEIVHTEKLRMSIDIIS